MKPELLDKQVICIYDIRAIQKYIFGSVNNIDILGSGYLLDNIQREALFYALKNNPFGLMDEEYSMQKLDNPEELDSIPYFSDEKIKAQVITISGGNAFMLYRTGRLCQAVNRAFSKYILEKTYSLQIAITAVEMTDNISNDMNRLYVELDKAKNADPILRPMGALPIVKKEVMTGNAIVALDEFTGEELSGETIPKRNITRVGDKTLGDADSYDEMRRCNERLAYIHIDGNSMGLTIGNIVNNQNDYEAGIKVRRHLSYNIDFYYFHVLFDVENWLFEQMKRDGIPEERIRYYYQRIHLGGDDVNVVMAYQYAFDFVEKFVRDVSKTKIWNDPINGDVYLSVCAGIGFVDSSITYKEGIRLAEECCEEAKEEAKKAENLINGKVGNWVDFQINNNRIINDVSTIRENTYISIDDVNLCLRPYCMDEERADTPTHYSNLKNYIYVLRDQIPNKRFIDEVLFAYSRPREAIQIYLEDNRRFGGTLKEKLGTPYLTVEGRSQECAAWYDALELIRYGL